MNDLNNAGKMNCYEVWRQDDNGNKFLVKHVGSENEADRLVETMTARGHKQTYWAEPCSKHAKK